MTRLLRVECHNFVPCWYTKMGNHTSGRRGPPEAGGRLRSLPATRSIQPVPRSASRRNGEGEAGGDDLKDPLHYSDHTSRVFRELRELIVWGQLPPGARIAERTVAERLGVSRSPVRSALHRLQQEGFVASAGNGRDRRLIVAPMTQSDGEELYLMVGHLEGRAARFAAALPVAERRELVARMRGLNKDLAVALREATDVNKVFDLDVQFHAMLVEGIVGPRMLALHRSIKPQIERYARAYVGVLLQEFRDSIHEHELILSAISRGDLKAAQQAVENNWDHAADRLIRAITAYGERGGWRTLKPRNTASALYRSEKDQSEPRKATRTKK